MKKIHVLVLFVTFSLFLGLLLQSCIKIQSEMFDAKKILLYAKPEGGICLYDFSNKKIHTLTSKKDYFPQISNDQETIYFLRIISKETKKQEQANPTSSKQILESTLANKTERWSEILTYNLRTKTEKKISSVPLYDPGSNPKDFVKFVDQYRKIIVLSNFFPTRLFEVSTGKMITENPSIYYEECNVATSKTSFIVHVRQIPKTEYLVSLDELTAPDYHDSLYEISTNGSIKEIKKIGKKDIYDKSFSGYTFYPFDKSLIYSFDKNIILRKEDGKEAILSPGIHPSCLYINETINDVLKFPWFHCSFLLQDEEKMVIAEQNRFSILDKKEKDLTIITKDSLQIINQEKDPNYLFDHLEWISFLKNKSSLLLISSKKANETAGPDRIVDLNKNPDLILVFSWLNGSIVKHFESYGKRDFTLDFKDLDQDGQNEIINQYSGSNFLCEERFQAAGRSLIWIDVYKANKNGIYETANQKFPKIYQDLLNRLKPFHQRAVTASRLKEPILCKDDLEKLETLVREAEIIVKTQQ